MAHLYPKYHAIVTQRVAVADGHITIPVVYLNTGGKITRVQMLVDYFLDNSGRSQQWMRYRARVFGYFFDYCSEIKLMPEYSGTSNLHRKVIRNFLMSLLNGTMNHENASDPLKLYWTPTSYDVVSRLTKALTGIIDYCDDNDLIDKNYLSKHSSAIPTSEPASLNFLYVANKLKRTSFFGHLISANNLARRLSHKAKSSPFYLSPPKKVNQTAPKRFPEELIVPFFDYGFIKDENADLLEDKENITAKMIFLLIFFGGLRETEPLHIWVNDIISVEGYGIKVMQRHPSDSLTYIAGDNISRNEYLRRIGRLPRHLENSKSKGAGWKNLALDKDSQSMVYFIHEEAENLFFEMYSYYINEYRPKLMKALVNNGKVEHPFLFVSRGVDRNSGKSYIGEPYSASAIESAFNTALDKVERKLGISIPRGRNNNTNIHAARHFYIGTLKDAGLDAKAIQVTVKHGSVESQKVYDLPTQERVQKTLDNVKLQSAINFGKRS